MRERSGRCGKTSSQHQIGVAGPDWSHESVQLRGCGRIVGIQKYEHVGDRTIRGQGGNASLTGAAVPDAGFGYRSDPEGAGDAGCIVRRAVVDYDHAVNALPGQFSQGHRKGVRFIAGRDEDGDSHCVVRRL